MQTIKQDINQYHHNEITPIIKQYQQHETQNTEHNPQTCQTSNYSNAERRTQNAERETPLFLFQIHVNHIIQPGGITRG